MTTVLTVVALWCIPGARDGAYIAQLAPASVERIGSHCRLTWDGMQLALIDWCHYLGEALCTARLEMP